MKHFRQSGISTPQEQLRKAYRAWMQPMHFTHFVTLASNNQMASNSVMKDRLRAWDGRINRELLGPKWQKKFDERMHWIAFPEKLGVNPHWHILMQLLPEQLEEFDDFSLLDRRSFNEVLARNWSKLMPSGTCDVKLIPNTAGDKDRIYNYVTKSLGYQPNLEGIVIFREYFEL